MVEPITFIIIYSFLYWFLVHTSLQGISLLNNYHRVTIVNLKGPKVIKLPTRVHNGLCMTCVLHAYSHLVKGTGITKRQQLFTFYHGRDPNRPSQRKLMFMGSLEYCVLYTAKQQVVRSDDTTYFTNLTIKPFLTLHLNDNYYAGIKMNVVN